MSKYSSCSPVRASNVERRIRFPEVDLGDSDASSGPDVEVGVGVQKDGVGGLPARDVDLDAPHEVSFGRERLDLEAVARGGDVPG